MSLNERSANESVIVVGVDGSPASEDALRWAAQQARLTGSVLEPVMTWDYPNYYDWATPGWPEDINFGEDAQKSLDHSIEAVLGSSPDVIVRPVVIEGHPAPTLVQLSKSASLLVVGSRGHGAFAGMLLGSVSEHLATHAHCPVAIIHGKRDEASAST